MDMTRYMKLLRITYLYMGGQINTVYINSAINNVERTFGVNFNFSAEELQEIYYQIQDVGSGMIVLIDQPSDAKVTIEKITDESDPEKSTYVLRTEVSDSENWLTRFLQNFGIDRAIYNFHMEGWAGNYSRPLEFFMSLHTATMAPEFVYRVATDYEIDTKVYIKFFETKAQIELVGPNDETLEDIKAEILKELLSYVEGGQNLGSYDEIIEYLKNSNKLHYWILGTAVESMQNDLPIRTYKVDSIDIVVTDLYPELEDIINLYNAIVEVQTNESGGKLYIPYIAAVENHWYQNLYFENYIRDGQVIELSTYAMVEGGQITLKDLDYTGNNELLDGYTANVTFTERTLVQMEDPEKRDNSKHFRDLLKSGLRKKISATGEETYITDTTAEIPLEEGEQLIEYGGEGYYIYDGSEYTKDAIELAKAIENNNVEKQNEIKAKYQGTETEIEPATRQAISPEDLKLNAFSMLESTKGEDAALCLRYLKEMFNEWDPDLEGGETESVYSSQGLRNNRLDPSLIGNSVEATTDEIDLLERVVAAEARGEPYEGQVAVAAVVLNRYEREGGRLTLTQILTSENQFASPYEGEVPSSVKNAVADALAGYDPTISLVRYDNSKPRQVAGYGALYFHSADTSMENEDRQEYMSETEKRWREAGWFDNNIIMRIGGHFFYGQYKPYDTYENFSDFMKHIEKDDRNENNFQEVVME